MKRTRVLAIAAIAMSLWTGTTVAQSGSDVKVPAEFPPDSFTGRQYVDSRGCVYIRAGIDGAVSWIPRMTRDRKVICGFKPTAAGTRTAQQATTQTTGVQEPVVIEVPQSQTPTAQAKLAPVAAEPKQRKVRVVTATKPKVVAKPVPKAVTVAKPVKVKTAPVKTVRVTRPAGDAAQSCPGASKVSSQYMRARGNVTLRCGPQTQPHATVIYKSGTTVRAAPVAGTQVRVAPRHVYENQQVSQVGVSVPKGYKPVWEDDRLNPKRAHQTFAGKAQMELAWTKSVPRRLIDRRSGREVTYKYPGLQYPYTSFEQQRAAGVTISTRGRAVEDPIRVVRTKSGALKRVDTGEIIDPGRVKVVRKTAAAQATVSTRSVEPKVEPKKVVKAASHRFVQAGVFGDPNNAKRAAQRIANSGLPARMGKLKQNGKFYTVVLAGPFKTQGQLQTALSQVRRAGFLDAFPRK